MRQLALIISLAVFATPTTPLQDRFIEQLVHTAKAQGQKEVAVGCPMSSQPVMPSLQHGVNGDVLVAQLANHVAVIRGHCVVTFWKFKVVESITGGELPAWQGETSTPSEMFPVSADEFIFWTTGGSVFVDDVRLHSPEEINFLEERRYLIFTGFDGSPKSSAEYRRVNVLAVYVPNATFELRGDRIVAASPEAEYLASEWNKQFGGSFRTVRAEVRRLLKESKESQGAGAGVR